MRFGDCYDRAEGKRPVLSFEVFPPKTDAAMTSFQRVIPELVKLGPDFVTVTYGALGSTRERTVEIARRVKAEHRIETACHLTCVGSTAAEIDDILDEVQAAGIQNIVALRGDPPRGETEFRPVEGGYAHAVDLVRHVAGRGGFGIAVAGYPETHIEAVDSPTDLAHLREKVRAGADAVITQLFYDNATFFRFVEDARRLGIDCPIVPGILPILSRKQILRITEMCGASIPEALAGRLEEAGEEREADVGVEQAVEQVVELLENGAPGIHLYVLNRSNHIKRIIEQIPADLILRSPTR
jgi:methylenetetrahydrofolate reductase (NADPH)